MLAKDLYAALAAAAHAPAAADLQQRVLSLAPDQRAPVASRAIKYHLLWEAQPRARDLLLASASATSGEVEVPFLTYAASTFEHYRRFLLDVCQLPVDHPRVALQRTFQSHMLAERSLVRRLEESLVERLMQDFDAYQGDSPSAPGEHQRAALQALAQLEWRSVLGDCASEVLQRAITVRVGLVYPSLYEEHVLGDLLEHWLHGVALPWLRAVRGQDGDPTTLEVQQLEFHALSEFAKLRIAELFDIITDFPHSLPAVQDLKTCLLRTHQQRELVASMRAAFARRLLHPGANTNSILLMYVRTIKVLRHIDPSGVLLESVSEPVKEYLRGRPETVRCVVSTLTNDADGELYAELGTHLDPAEIQPIEFEQGKVDGDDEPAPRGAPEWEPDPVDADPRNTARSRTSNDILGLLVNIFGSKELFVDEFRHLLADKLMSNLDFDADREVMNLEILKMRFGDASMHECEIMVKDVAESRRVNANLKSAAAQAAEPAAALERTGATLQHFDATIISRHFWPAAGGIRKATAEESLALHPTVRDRAEAFAKEYSVLKNPRRLEWRPALGLVQLQLELEDGTSKQFSVSPLHATLVMHLAERAQCTAAELAELTHVSEDLVAKKMSYWVIQGMALQTSPRVYAPARSSSDHASRGARSPGRRAGESEVEDDEMWDSVPRVGSAAGGRAAGSTDALVEAMGKFEGFVFGMLTNLGALPAERIHNNLSLFASAMGPNNKYDRSPGELSTFLDVLVSREKLEKTAEGMYRLPRP